VLPSHASSLAWALAFVAPYVFATTARDATPPPLRGADIAVTNDDLGPP